VVDILTATEQGAARIHCRCRFGVLDHLANKIEPSVCGCDVAFCPVTLTVELTIDSAGVGRTGTFIVIDSMLERIKHVDTVDIYGHVTCLRAQRNYMVQTEDQYMFIHEAVLEAVTAGNTEILARQLRSHVRQLTTTPMNHQQNALQLEFQVLTPGGAVYTLAAPGAALRRQWRR